MKARSVLWWTVVAAMIWLSDCNWNPSGQRSAGGRSGSGARVRAAQVGDV